jgi:hypothetical protein
MPVRATLCFTAAAVQSACRFARHPVTQVSPRRAVPVHPPSHPRHRPGPLRRLSHSRHRGTRFTTRRASSVLYASCERPAAQATLVVRAAKAVPALVEIRNHRRAQVRSVACSGTWPRESHLTCRSRRQPSAAPHLYYKGFPVCQAALSQMNREAIHSSSI